MNVKTLKKYEKKTIQKLLVDTVYWVNRHVRLRDCDDNGIVTQGCISTGIVMRWGEYDAGHYYPAGNYPTLRFNMDNIHAQSRGSNYYGHGDLAPYRARLEDRIGHDRCKTLDRLAKQDKTKKKIWDRIMLIELIEHHKECCKQLEKQKNFL